MRLSCLGQFLYHFLVGLLDLIFGSTFGDAEKLVVVCAHFTKEELYEDGYLSVSMVGSVAVVPNVREHSSQV